MPHLTISEIQWDTEGQPQSECDLPHVIIVLDAPADWSSSEYQELLMFEVEETFGFKHHGYRLIDLNLGRRERMSAQEHHDIERIVEVIVSP